MNQVTIVIVECKDCNNADLRYEKGPMDYRNRCSLSDYESNNVHIGDGSEIPDNCPLLFKDQEEQRCICDMG